MNEIKFEMGETYLSFYTVFYKGSMSITTDPYKFTVLEIKNGENIVFQRENGKKIKTKIKRRYFDGGYFEYAEANKYFVSAKRKK